MTRIKDLVRTWFLWQQKIVFADGTRRLVSLYKLCVEAKGVEKRYTLYSSQNGTKDVIN